MANFVTKLVTGALPLFGGLNQNQTNGLFEGYGTLPKYLGEREGHPPPWANHTWGGDTVTERPPDTGVTRHYHFNVHKKVLAPDGFTKEMMVINGQYPGPLVEANWGDWVEIKVTNQLETEGTSIHWHGLLQNETPWYDGVPGISQCPIAPGSEFTFRFRADHVGITWYHSHYSAQLADGIVGGMVFYGPQTFKYDIDMGPVLLNDYYHPGYEQLVERVMGNQTEHFAFSDNNLINGKMNFDCSIVKDGTPCKNSAGISKFRLQPGKDHLFRVANVGSAGMQYFTLDDHEMTVVSNDFIPIHPFKTKVLTLGVGQRHEIIVRGKTGAEAKKPYFMRGTLSPLCHLPHQPYSLAAMYYNDEDFKSNKEPRTNATPIDEHILECGNEPLTKTVPLKAVPAKEPDMTLHLQLVDTRNSTGHQTWLVNNQTFRINYNHPILKLANEGNFTYPFDPQWNTYNTHDAKVVRIIWENNKFERSDPNFYNLTFAHPMHLHGHDYQVLSAGDGKWDGTVINAENPNRRDTTLLPPNGHLVTQFETDNPGIWPFHCHVAWHVSAGLMITIMERPEELTQRKQIPAVMSRTCKDWDAWSKNNVVNQIDSGLKLKKMAIRA